MELAAALGMGLLAGVVSGLLGVGGGIVLTPFLHYVGGRSWSDSVALSLFVIALQSPMGVWRHAKKGAVDWRLAGLLAVAGVVGVALGDRALTHLTVPALKAFFAGLMLFAAWRLGGGAVRAASTARWPALPIGLGAGFVSRILGVGGGVLTVPTLSLLGTPAHVAVGTSLVAVFTNAAIASGANLARGLAWTDGIVLAAGAIAGSVLGVRAAHALPEKRLRRVVAVALTLVAGLVLVDVLRNGL